MTAASDRPARARALAGAGLGLAAGFVVWMLAVPLAGVTYHYGNTSGPADVVRLACLRAGRLWLFCAAVGASGGALLGVALARHARALVAAAAIATGAYVLALRGAWGWNGPPLAPGARALALPAIAVAVPVAIAVVLCLLLARSERDRASLEGAPTLTALHLCLSLGAAHLALQLPYYLGLRDELLAGLGDLVRLVVP
ncbi:MAG TPA: hypothetical protein VKA21_06320 [Candidatus Binatia bacterium]|nr:hypothetical protein [Candidatus Binatia bacterium]